MQILHDKVAVVTGATSGIGARIAEVFAAEGAHVVLAARREERGEQLAASLGAGTSFMCTDVCVEDDVRRLIDQTLERFGHIDCLVNNAGTLPSAADLTNIALADFDAAIAMHVRSALAGMKYVAPGMIRQGAGSIINIGSIAGIRAGIGSLAYSTAKAALLHLTRCAAVELGEHGVRVNSISPGPIVTGIFAKASGWEPERADRETEAIREAFMTTLPAVQPLRRMGQPDDVAQAALYLASDHSSFLTGHDLVVDGGSAAGRPASVMREQRKALADVIHKLGSAPPHGDPNARLSS